MSILHIEYPGMVINSVYPLYYQKEVWPLPDSVHFWTQPITILFSHVKMPFSYEKITEFVKYQYNEAQIPLPPDYKIQKKEKEDSSETSTTGTITEYNDDLFETFIPTDPDDDFKHLQESLNMIFSLAPCAQVKLIYFDQSPETIFNLPVRYKLLYDRIRELQSQFTDAVYIENSKTPSLYATSDFYYYFLEGFKSTCRPTIEPIRIPMFLSAGNEGWIVDGKAFKSDETYVLEWYTKDFLCHVGGCFPISSTDFAAFSLTSSGFCSSFQCNPRDPSPRYALIYPDKTCDDTIPPYQFDYNVNLPEVVGLDQLPQRPIRPNSSFRIPDVCHIAGSYILDNFESQDQLDIYQGIFGTSFAVVMFGIQFAQMKYYYNGEDGKPFFLKGEGSFLSKMYQLQIQSSGQAFKYVDKNTIIYPEGTPDPDPLNNCAFEKYQILKTPEQIVGLNPCGLGLPKWFFIEKILDPEGKDLEVQNSVWTSQ